MFQSRLMEGSYPVQRSFNGMQVLRLYLKGRFNGRTTSVIAVFKEELNGCV